MTRRTTIAAVLAGFLAAGCSLAGSRSPRPGGEPDTGLRVWAPPILRWEPGRDRVVEFAVENGTRRAIRVAVADPAYARVEMFAGPESLRVCGVEPRQGRAASAETVVLEPGDRLAIRVDLDEACGETPAGDYRYEVSYRLPDTGASGAVTGTLPAAHGHLLVEAGDPDAPRRRVGARTPRPDAR